MDPCLYMKGVKFTFSRQEDNEDKHMNTEPATTLGFTIIPDIASMVASITPDSIVSRTVYQGPTLRIIVFGFAAGQELSEHTSSKEAVLHFLRGEATVTLGKL